MHKNGSTAQTMNFRMLLQKTQVLIDFCPRNGFPFCQMVYGSTVHTPPLGSSQNCWKCHGQRTHSSHRLRIFELSRIHFWHRCSKKCQFLDLHEFQNPPPKTNSQHRFLHFPAHHVLPNGPTDRKNALPPPWRRRFPSKFGSRRISSLTDFDNFSLQFRQKIPKIPKIEKCIHFHPHGFSA